jgi:aminoglycoside/choline kinase family phosphotransferase
VILEDLGDSNLQSVIRQTADSEDIIAHYRAVIDLLVFMGVKGAEGFDLKYTYQTPYYDRALILEKEARYFVEAFLNGYRGLKIAFHTLEDEFELLAQRALEHPYTGLVHRDFQSRNILVKNGRYYFVDFQGARIGPLTYDLASLLIDPYVELPRAIQDTLLKYYVERLSDLIQVEEKEYLQAYRYSAINRNLQILGAFAFLSREKGKKNFEAYIPIAVKSLTENLLEIEPGTCTQLRRIVDGL